MDDYKLTYQGDGIQIYVHVDVRETWGKHRQLMPNNNESFGVLIGSCSCDMTDYWIESVTTPCPDDTSSRYGFCLKDKCHQEAVDKSFEISKGKTIYFGTWHTHPEKYPTPSTTDMKDWKKCIKRNRGRQMFFVIVGINDMRLYKYNDKKFESLIIK